MAKVDLVEIDAARINDVCDAYFKWKDLNNSLKNYCSRGLNFPETISEPMGCYSLNYLWNKGSAGDAQDRNGRKIEMKATSNFDSDLTSFGPKCHFDNLVFLRLNYQNNKLYVYDTGINSEELKNLPANKSETVGEQQAQKRRPHISVIKTIIEDRNLEPTCIFNIRRAELE
ncbi:TPA: Bsp6I family type II restriction endonuclease [Clostridioides difficile]|uniref:Bsp6I family type II restriction endonuclease n=1 Tax=Clostridioides difficile TaxID=1496 RepID=UPI00082564B4|nr:Bsp6I family type II restriction endonuclease [Clostridioides difficile]OFU34413.1 hypothetical protein HMPREF3075_03990 [Clostridium sp. HMSC19B11]EGT3847227.1 Bsp6I family restriction endonuclease [Clostridioides difficile]EGT4699155.1 Bsp6I family restriction endonuclease [Clostridioides difficile]EGT4917758.1 Bsp6I family restriction endonuclease [Clostridioides difficile]EGT5475392.1 Bsp6I family restriction endonuclease [Clostridioides difficile]